LVASLARPGGNIIGFASYDASIIGKWVQLLKEAAPGVTRASILFNPDTALAPPLDRVIEEAPSVGMTVTLAPVHDDAGIEEAAEARAREPGGGLIILPDSFNVTHSHVIVAAALRYKLPSIGWTELVRADGLMSYWYDAVELHARAASYIDRILNGAKPADLPVQYPTKYSLIINLKTANALGLTVPPAMLDLADEVIE
jgi:putative ABC transport system substrate-binding protein